MASGSSAATVAKTQTKKSKKVKEVLGTKMKNIWDSGSKTDNGIKEI